MFPCFLTWEWRANGQTSNRDSSVNTQRHLGFYIESETPSRSPRMSAPLQSISIPRHEHRTDPPPAHVVYAILVSLPVRNWTVYRRYSEFVELHASLCNQAGSSAQSLAPPLALPPKHAAKNTLRGIRTLGGFIPATSSLKSQDEDLLRERRQGLEAYLRAIVASPESVWRESTAFRDFLEIPSTTSSKVLVGSGGGGGGAAPTAPSGRTGGYKDSRYVPGSYSSSSSSSPHQQAPHRTLGKQTTVVETEATRGQSDSDLFASQQAQFDRQYAALGDLTAILRRQKQMGMAINQELLEQNELLDGLDEEVRETQQKLSRNEGQIKRL